MDLYQAETFIKAREVKPMTQRTTNKLDPPWWDIDITSCINTNTKNPDPSKVALFWGPQKHPLSSKQVHSPLRWRVLEILRATQKIPYKSTGIQQWQFGGSEFQGFGYGDTSQAKPVGPSFWLLQGTGTMSGTIVSTLLDIRTCQDRGCQILVMFFRGLFALKIPFGEGGMIGCVSRALEWAMPGMSQKSKKHKAE